MNPSDFLKVADKLKDSLEEADRRTAVSRAYYYVYHYIKAYLAEKNIISRKPKSLFAHDKLVDYLKNSGIDEVKTLGQAVYDLKTARVKADYDLHSIEFNQETCDLYLCKAKEAIEEFKNCKGNELVDGINNYKRKIRA